MPGEAGGIHTDENIGLLRSLQMNIDSFLEQPSQVTVTLPGRVPQHFHTFINMDVTFPGLRAECMMVNYTDAFICKCMNASVSLTVYK